MVVSRAHERDGGDQMHGDAIGNCRGVEEKNKQFPEALSPKSLALMPRPLPGLFAAFAAAVLCSVLAFTLGSHRPDAPSRLSIKLVHRDIAVRASSYAGVAQSDAELADMQALAASVTEDDARALSEHIFEKGKFSLRGSHNNGSSASFSTRQLRLQSGDRQFFVAFSTPADIYTLAALAKFTGRHVTSHVHDDVFIAIGGESFAARARRFPGVAWVQEREGVDKVGGSLKLHLEQLAQEPSITQLRRRLIPSTRVSDSNPIIALTAQCWHDACGAAAVDVKPLCPVVYVHAAVIDVMCAADMVERAVALLADHVGVEHVEIKERMEHKNFAGRAIVGTGPSATSPSQSRVLSGISVSNSVIGIADTGIDMSNCFFYDSTKNSFPYANSRVLNSYSYLPCASCSRCCASFSPSGCTNDLNSCGNSIDQDGHGTHTSGTIAGNAVDGTVSNGNGIAAGAKLFFQDIENRQPDAKCYYVKNGVNYCGGLNVPSDLGNLFQPAYDAGAYVSLSLPPLCCCLCVCLNFVSPCAACSS